MKLIQSDAPHIRTKDSVRSIMLDVLLALAPAVAVATFFFGLYALFLCLFGAIVGELIEWFIVRILRKQKDFSFDLSAAVTGLLLAMNLPPTAPWWLLLIGLLVALGVAKARLRWHRSKHFQSSARWEGVFADLLPNPDDEMDSTGQEFHENAMGCHDFSNSSGGTQGFRIFRSDPEVQLRRSFLRKRGWLYR